MDQGAFDLGDAGHDAVTYSVAELGDLINGTLRRTFGEGVWVRGEIKGWNKSAAGHIYFDLVESDGRSKAVLSVVFFAGAQHRPRERFRRAGLKLGEGLRVRIFGTLDFHGGSGKLSLRMTDIDARYTLGDLALRRAALVQSLVARGLYDANRRHELAPAPLRVGVVTSVGTAAWHDFHDELVRSEIGFRLVIADVRVQGDGAPRAVSGAIHRLAQRSDLDVIVVIRGGGARNELATFDHELVAESIATCPLPVFTGIGHEVDRSVADEVAHTCVKTPTACAAALVVAVRSFRQRTEATWTAIARASATLADAEQRRLGDLAGAIRGHTLASVQRSDERLHRRATRLRTGAQAVIGDAERSVEHAIAAIGRTPARIDPELRHVDALAVRVRLLDPVNTMARGWSITRTADGRTIRDAAQLAPGQVLVTTFATGTTRSTIEEITP
jgi:exodeoxyribonuclease VII large subunit